MERGQIAPAKLVQYNPLLRRFSVSELLADCLEWDVVFGAYVVSIVTVEDHIVSDDKRFATSVLHDACFKEFIFFDGTRWDQSSELVIDLQSRVAVVLNPLLGSRN